MARRAEGPFRLAAALSLGLGLGMALGLGAPVAAAQACAGGAFEAFTEPSAVVELAAYEAGVLATLEVEPGDAVRRGDLIGRLDSSVAQAGLELAETKAAAGGRLALAKARLDLAQKRMEQIGRLRRSGAARPLELIEAEAELAIAEADVAAVRDEQRFAEADVARARAQLATREIRASIDGVVDIVHRDEGEFVNPGDPRVVTLLSVDPLHATLYVDVACTRRLSPGGRLDVEIGDTAVAATIRDIGRRIDAPTGLVGVALTIPNADGAWRAGQRVRSPMMQQASAR